MLGTYHDGPWKPGPATLLHLVTRASLSMVWVVLALVGVACEASAQPPRDARPAQPQLQPADAGRPAAIPRDLPGAQAALEHGQYAVAEQAFQALARGRTQGAALLGLARVQLETGRYD